MSQEGYAESRDIMLKAWNTMLLFFWGGGGMAESGKGEVQKARRQGLILHPGV